MLKKTFLLTCAAILFLGMGLKAQKYKELVFTDVKFDENISYSMDDNDNDKKSHLFDLYQPEGDNTPKRPLIIWMHGGGFKFGSKDAKGIKLWCKTFAKRGYVCAGINYTLSKKDPFFHFGELKKSTYYAVQDARMAIAYFRKNATKYHIDPDMIILAGNSAGGIMALLTAYTSNAELATKAGFRGDKVDNIFANDRVKVAAVVNYWGGIFDLDWLRNAKTPIVNVLGSEDGMIPPDHKGDDIFGGIAIHKEADARRIPNALKVFEGYSHELQKHFNPIFSVDDETQERWLQAGQFTADFLYDQLWELRKM